MRAQEVAYRFSVTVCGHADDAEDVMQEALIKTYRYAGRIREPEAFRPWLYRTVRNACLMRRRLRVDEPRTFASLDDLMPTPDGVRSLEIQDPGKDPEAVVVNRRLRRRLAEALQSLPPPHRIVVFLREMEGLSTREVAKVLGISEANVKTRCTARGCSSSRGWETSNGRTPGAEAGRLPDAAGGVVGYLDGELSAARCRKIERHLEACPCCGYLAVRLRRAVAVCRSAGRSKLPADVRRQAKARITEFAGPVGDGSEAGGAARSYRPRAVSGRLQR